MTLSQKSVEVLFTVLAADAMVVLQRKSHRRDTELARVLDNCKNVTCDILDAGSKLTGECCAVSAQVQTKLNLYLSQDCQVPEGIDPSFGKLGSARAKRKREQCASMACHFYEFSHGRNKVVEFGCGSGHLGILLAWLYPRCTFLLLERKIYTCDIAATRINLADLNNCAVLQGEIQDLVSQRKTFDVGLSLHSCGLFTDEILGLCSATSASFLLCPCCYGQVASDSAKLEAYSSGVKEITAQDLNLVTRGADLMHSGTDWSDEQPWYLSTKRCMQLIDALRLKSLECDYECRISDLSPLTCSPKNNILLGHAREAKKLHAQGTGKYDLDFCARVEKTLNLFRAYALEKRDDANCTLIKSVPWGFRLRCRLAVVQSTSTSIEYGVFEKGSVVTQPLLQLQSHVDFMCADWKIRKAMVALRNVLNMSEYIPFAQCLRAVHFLTTLDCDGRTLITLVYAQSLDSSVWKERARRIEQQVRLYTQLDVGLIGRAKKQRVLCDVGHVDETLIVGSRVLRYMKPEGVFSNPNGFVNTRVLEWMSAICAKIPHVSSKALLELYCGNCNHSVALSSMFKSILAVEIEAELCDAARANVRENGCNNVRVVQGDADKEIFKREMSGYIDSYDVILVDPPRKGLEEHTLKLLASFTHVIYVSCRPKSLIANIGTSKLSESHTVVEYAIIDQFPYTQHTEVAMLFSRKGPR